MKNDIVRLKKNGSTLIFVYPEKATSYKLQASSQTSKFAWIR